MKSEGYNPAFDIDLKYGEVQERRLQELFTSKGRLEVKRDRQAHRTGNAVIEVESRGKPSGLSTTNADYWVYWIDELDTGIIISTDRLKTLVNDCRSIRGGDDNTSVLKLIRLEELIGGKRL